MIQHKTDHFRPLNATKRMMKSATVTWDQKLSRHGPKILSAVVPASLAGGSVAIYMSVLQHPSSTLTPLSYLYMLLLAIQYSLQPRLSKRYISKKTNKQSVALVEEVVKTGIAATVLCQKAPQTRDALHWTLSSSFTVAALPAMLYAFQGVLQYTSHMNLDPVTFNGLSQTKTLFAALACYLLMGKPQSLLQLLALALLFGSAVLFQNGTATTVQRQKESRDFTWWYRGVMPCLGATALSGFAGALSQKGLQQKGGVGRDPYLYTVEISIYSALTLMFPLVLRRRSLSWDGWSSKTMIPIVWKAIGGVLTALVHKSAGSVPKGFALMLGLVFSGIYQSILSKEDMTLNQIGGTLLVIVSGWLHFTHPPSP